MFSIVRWTRHDSKKRLSFYGMASCTEVTEKLISDVLEPATASAGCPPVYKGVPELSVIELLCPLTRVSFMIKEKIFPLTVTRSLLLVLGLL
jgi:hypothetical protein